MNNFLIHNMKLWKKRLQNQSITKHVHFILGNMSCDLDSCVSSITLAWIKQQLEECTTSLYIPVMNICRSRFNIRTEITYLLKDLGISSENLLFRNEIDFHVFVDSKDLKLSLVDHHVFVRADNYLDEYVVEIIDHRDQARRLPDSVDVNIVLVGSCSTLIAEMLQNSNITDIPFSIKKLLSGAILLDTNNLSSTTKTTERDVSMVDWLCPNKKDQEVLYKQLKNAKYLIDHLSTFDLLVKDLKLVEGSLGTIVFSSIHMDLYLFLKRSDIENAIVDCLTENNSFGWIGLFPPLKIKNEFYKPLIVWSKNKMVNEKFASSLISNKDLCIQTVEDQHLPHNFISLQMKNVNRTRKQVLPVVKSFLDDP